jgi:hypothetical protein
MFVEIIGSAGSFPGAAGAGFFRIGGVFLTQRIRIMR